MALGQDIKDIGTISVFLLPLYNASNFYTLTIIPYAQRTGSYPQIIHESSKEVTGGKIVLNSRGLVLEEPSLSYVLRWITDLTAKGLMGWSQEKKESFKYTLK